MRFQYLLTVFLFSGIVLSAQPVQYENIRAIYDSLAGSTGQKPDFDLFQHGLSGYATLIREERISDRGILTLIDFRKSSNEKRMWVIDLGTKTIRYNSLVAHGRNSGELYATKFSNILNSNQSSLGFFSAGATYIGKHGTSLKLHGLEKGINDKAEQRAIVMHGAEYVSGQFIDKIGRLGRSFGCPAIPMEIHEQVINLLADGTCLFIYYPDANYLAKGVLSRREEKKDYFTDVLRAESNASSNK